VKYEKAPGGARDATDERGSRNLGGRPPIDAGLRALIRRLDARCLKRDTKCLRDRHWNPAPVASFLRRRPDPYERNVAISWHFERAAIPYALETDWPVGAAGFEPLHLRIRIREDSPLGAAGFEPTHLN
jgi:hypothetical protein